MTRKFYINKKTKRMIKSPGKTFSKLKHKNVLEKEHCLYDLKSAKKCFYKLLKLYPKVVYLSSNFATIPKTYKMNTIKGLRAFIKQDDYIIAFINKYGFIYRLRDPININNLDNKSFPVVTDYNNTLPNFIKTLPKISKNIQKKVYYQINNIKPNKNVNILFNNIQRDFIPINKKMSKREHEKILSVFNDTLIKNKSRIYEVPDYPKVKRSPKPSIYYERSIAPSSTRSSITPSTVSSITPSTVSSIAPSTVSSIIPSTVSSITPSIISSITHSTVPSSTLPSILSQEPTPPSTPTSTPPTPPPTPTSILSTKPETSSTPLSKSLDKGFNLSLVNDKLMNTLEIPSSSIVSNIKIIQDENGSIIGFFEK